MTTAGLEPTIIAERCIVRCPHCGTDFTPSHLETEIERLREVIKANNYAQDITLREAGAKIAEAAAFLDRAARDLHDTGWVVLADECRTTAEKLRGEGFGPFDVNPGGQYQP